MPDGEYSAIVLRSLLIIHFFPPFNTRTAPPSDGTCGSVRVALCDCFQVCEWKGKWKWGKDGQNIEQIITKYFFYLKGSFSHCKNKHWKLLTEWVTSGKMDMHGNNLEKGKTGRYAAPIGEKQSTFSNTPILNLLCKKKKESKKAATLPTLLWPKWSEKIEWEGMVEEGEDREVWLS